MFYLLSILSPIGYAAQITFLAHMSRKMDALDIGFYRNTSLLITLLPLLFLVPINQIMQVISYLPQFLLIGCFAVISLWGRFESFRYLPVGISSSVRRAMVTLFILPLSFIFLGERITLIAFVFIMLAIAAVVFLGLQKNHLDHLDSRTMKGVLLLVATAIPSSINFFFVAKLSRELNPFVAGYFWEASIALAAGIFLLIRYFKTGKRLKWIGFKKVSKIGLAASPTILGTGAFVWASSLGPLAIVSSFSLLSIVVSTLMSHYIYHEKLTIKQWLGMAICILAVAGLKFMG